MDHQALTELFRKLGARGPEDWARSQIEEKLPQVARYLFLRQAWGLVVGEENTAWIDHAIASAAARPDEPYAGVGHALRRLRVAGATDADMTDLVRGMQAELLFQFCYLLEEPGPLEPEVSDVAWALVQVDGAQKVVGRIIGLHESVLETDPTGREMRPRAEHG
jgi:hypothetical protein